MHDNYKLLLNIFRHYAVYDIKSPFSISFNGYRQMVNDFKILDNTKFCNNEAIDLIFCQVNATSATERDTSANDDFEEIGDNGTNSSNALTRYELIEILVRIGLAKYYLSKKCSTALNAVKKIFTEHIKPMTVEKGFANYSDEWRDARLYRQDVHNMYKKKMGQLKSLWMKYTNHHQHLQMTAKEWLRCMVEKGMVSEDLPKRDVMKCFVSTKMLYIDEMNTHEHTVLTFTDFLEAIGRVSEMKHRGPKNGTGPWNKQEGDEVLLSALVQKSLEMTIFRSYGRMMRNAAHKINVAKTIQNGPQRLAKLFAARQAKPF